jgi:RNase P/RNase MRP subunit p29
MGRVPDLRPRIESSGAGDMRNRASIAVFPARGTQRRRACLRTWALAILVSTWTGAWGAARADTFVLKSGEPIEGSIVQATRNTLIIRRAIGGMHQMSIRGVAKVRIDLVRGERVSGQLLSWADGVYQIRSVGEVVRISEGRILSRAPLEAEPSPAPPPRPREERTVETAAAPAASAARRISAEGIAAHGGVARMPAAEVAAPRKAKSDSQAVAVEAAAAPAARAAQRVGAKDIAVNRGSAEMPTAGVAAAREASSDSEAVALEASVDPAEAGSAGMVFRIELSRPAEQTIVLIYGTVDGTARAGTDYEPQQGVIALAPGTRSTQVRVPLIDHQRPRDDARFELFLTADPKVVQVVDQRITATIPGDN